MEDRPEKITTPLFAVILLLLFPVVILLTGSPEYLPLLGGWQCPFHALTGLPCMSCGMTRAMFSAVHFDLPAAIRYNALILVLVFVWGYCLWYFGTQLFIKKRPGKIIPARWWFIVIVPLALIYWICRMIMGF